MSWFLSGDNYWDGGKKKLEGVHLRIKHNTNNDVVNKICEKFNTTIFNIGYVKLNKYIESIDSFEIKLSINKNKEFLIIPYSPDWVCEGYLTEILILN
jgi:hypothetical protein